MAKPKTPPAIGVDEWRSAFQHLLTSSKAQDGHTFREIKRALGLGESRLRDLLKDLVAEGSVRAVICRGVSITGEPCRDVRYQLVGIGISKSQARRLAVQAGRAER